jgi:hypothetical protein
LASMSFQSSYCQLPCTIVAGIVKVLKYSAIDR